MVATTIPIATCFDITAPPGAFALRTSYRFTRRNSVSCCGPGLLNFSYLSPLVRGAEHTLDRRHDQLTAAQSNHTAASQGIERGRCSLPRGADQARQFALRQRDGILRSTALRAERFRQLRHVVEDAV